jgi:hypothetical protein
MRNQKSIKLVPTPPSDLLNKPVGYLFAAGLLKIGATDQCNVGQGFLTVMLKEHIYVAGFIRDILAEHEVYIYGGKR